MTTQLPFTCASNHDQNTAIFGIGTSLVIINDKDTTVIENAHESHVCCAIFCNGLEHVISVGDDKTLRLWDWRQKKSIGELKSKKRISSVCVSKAGNVIFADKFGDVLFLKSIDELRGKKLDSTQGLLAMGHFSMITCMALTADDKYLITGDRDEHIRVSCYPRVMNIHSMCFGHQDVVSCIAPFRNEKYASYFVSGGLDGFVRLYHVSGSLADSILVSSSDSVIKQIAISDWDGDDNIVIVVAVEGSNSLFRLKVSGAVVDEAAADEAEVKFADSVTVNEYKDETEIVGVTTAYSQGFYVFGKNKAYFLGGDSVCSQFDVVHQLNAVWPTLTAPVEVCEKISAATRLAEMRKQPKIADAEGSSSH